MRSCLLDTCYRRRWRTTLARGARFDGRRMCGADIGKRSVVGASSLERPEPHREHHRPRCLAIHHLGLRMMFGVAGTNIDEHNGFSE